MKKFVYIIILLSGTCQAAGIYKWVDENGQTHYGAYPGGNNAQELKVKPGSPTTTRQPTSQQSRKEKQQKLLKAFETERKIKQKNTARKKAQEAKRKKNCILARNQLRGYQESKYLYDLDDKGDRRVLSHKQRQQATDKARAVVKKWCE